MRLPAECGQHPVDVVTGPLEGLPQAGAELGGELGKITTHGGYRGMNRRVRVSATRAMPSPYTPEEARTMLPSGPNRDQMVR
ncbi:hypothetical protein GCM10027521_33640 [Amycolatopsis cihanbeyliensis]